MSKRFCWVLLVSTILAGCSIQSSQLNAVIGLFNKPEVPFDRNSWSIEYGDYIAAVYPVTVDGGTVFSNQRGDVILFDGWTVREVTGLGHRLKLGIINDGASRRYMFGSRFVAQHQCDKWQSEQLSGIVRFSEFCWGQGQYTNIIQVDAEGSISLIMQNIDGSDLYLRLSKK
ncbi:hypothetical protein N9A54_02090 [Porticoccaceae bacterium]|nr:hypothetical protein [Porticoccaceae bacterium]